MTNIGLLIKDRWIISTNKKERAPVIVDFAKAHHYEGIVIFSIGNSDDVKRSILMSSLNLIQVSPGGDLQSANRWWTQDEIKSSWPNYFDATSGHLPVFLLNQVVIKIRSKFLGIDESGEYFVPTGSGETFVCMAMAFPRVKFRAVYNIDKYTQWNPNAPLNDMVKALADDVYHSMPEGNTHPTGGGKDETDSIESGATVSTASFGR